MSCNPSNAAAFHPASLTGPGVNRATRKVEVPPGLLRGEVHAPRLIETVMISGAIQYTLAAKDPEVCERHLEWETGYAPFLAQSIIRRVSIP